MAYSKSWSKKIQSDWGITFYQKQQKSYIRINTRTVTHFFYYSRTVIFHVSHTVSVLEDFWRKNSFFSSNCIHFWHVLNILDTFKNTLVFVPSRSFRNKFLHILPKTRTVELFFLDTWLIIKIWKTLFLLSKTLFLRYLVNNKDGALFTI